MRVTEDADGPGLFTTTFNVTFVPHCARKAEAKSLSHGANFHPPPSRPKTKKQNKKTLIRKLEQPVHSDQSRDRFPACSWMFSLSPLLSLTQVHLRVSPSTVTGSGLVEAVAACRQHEQQATQDTRCPGPRAKQPHFTPTPPSPVYPSLKRTKSFIK